MSFRKFQDEPERGGNGEGRVEFWLAGQGAEGYKTKQCFGNKKESVMAEELQHLIDRIRKEGVETGEQEAQALVAKAKEQAAGIVADAQKQAQALVAKAESDAQAFAERGRKTLEQAARDLLISVADSVGKVVTGIVDAKVGEALSPETVAQMLVKIAEQYAKNGGTQDLDALVSEKDLAALKGCLAKEYGGKLAVGIDVASDREIFKGFRVGVKGGQVFHDFSKDAIAESLANFLRPELAGLVKKAAE
jgi:V/A-type H+-transporting ATPase subunit E